MTLNTLLDDYHAGYIKNIDGASQRLYDLLLLELSNYTTQGVLDMNQERLAMLQQIIVESLRSSGYTEATDKYFQVFDAADEANLKYYRTQNIDVSEVIRDSEMLKMVKDNVLNTLRRGGAVENIIRPLENIIRQEVLLKKTVTETADLLRKVVVDDNFLLRHVDQVSFDAIRQYNGGINDETRKLYDLKYFDYIGSIIETSRPICDHIKDNFKGSISIDELKRILDIYCPNGIPSEKMITYTTIDGVTSTKKKGSGMYPGTTVDNFSQVCGGYRCRHEAKWTRFPKRRSGQ